MNLSIFTVFMKHRNFNSKIRRSKVTDCAALIFTETRYLLSSIYSCEVKCKLVKTS